METQTEIDPDAPTEAELAFEAEIRQRNPNRKRIVRTDLPSENRDDIKAFFLAKLVARDDLKAAEMAEAIMTDTQRKSQRLALEAEQTESIKLSLVAFIDAGGGMRHVDHVTPFVEGNDWGQDTWVVIRNAYQELHGVDIGALGKAVKGARTIGGGTAATASATPGAGATKK